MFQHVSHGGHQMSVAAGEPGGLGNVWSLYTGGGSRAGGVHLHREHPCMVRSNASSVMVTWERNGQND